METYSKFAAFGKSIVVGPESESLGDVCTSSCKLNSKLGGKLNRNEPVPFQPARWPQGVLQQPPESRTQRWRSRASRGS